MKQFNIMVADHVIEVDSEYRISKQYFRDFLTEKDADFNIDITPKDTVETQNIYNSKSMLMGWEGTLDSTSILRKIADGLVDYGALLIHGAAISVNGFAYVFIAPSGTGKTTHIMKWIENCPDSFVINGDKPFILTGGDDKYPRVFSSPWAGKEDMYAMHSAPLKAIIYIDRNEENSMEKIEFPQAFMYIFKQVFRASDEEIMRKTIQLIQKLKDKVSFWHFNCNNFKDDCFEIAYKTLIGDEN